MERGEEEGEGVKQREAGRGRERECKCMCVCVGGGGGHAFIADCALLVSTSVLHSSTRLVHCGVVPGEVLAEPQIPGNWRVTELYT